MSEYVECVNCGFVLLADSDREPEPSRVDLCPDCGEEEFEFTP